MNICNQHRSNGKSSACSTLHVLQIISGTIGMHVWFRYIIYPTLRIISVFSKGVCMCLQSQSVQIVSTKCSCPYGYRMNSNDICEGVCILCELVCACIVCVFCMPACMSENACALSTCNYVNFIMCILHNYRC